MILEIIEKLNSSLVMINFLAIIHSGNPLFISENTTI